LTPSRRLAETAAFLSQGSLVKTVLDGIRGHFYGAFKVEVR
jgi:hypothetical protein